MGTTNFGNYSMGVWWKRCARIFTGFSFKNDRRIRVFEIIRYARRWWGASNSFFVVCFFDQQPIDVAGSLHQNASDKNWRNRRSQKLDKMELLNLQSSLQSEIQAKAAISEELSRTRADLVAAQKYFIKWCWTTCGRFFSNKNVFFVFAEIYVKHDSDTIRSVATWNARIIKSESCNNDSRIVKAVSRIFIYLLPDLNYSKLLFIFFQLYFGDG